VCDIEWLIGLNEWLIETISHSFHRATRRIRVTCLNATHRMSSMKRVCDIEWLIETSDEWVTSGSLRHVMRGITASGEWH